MFRIKFDKQGIEGLMQPYKWLILNYLWDAETRLSSGEIHQYLKIIKTWISRASVIFFLEALAKNGLADKTTKSGKGGYAGRYEMKITRQEFPTYLIENTVKKIKAVYPASKIIDEIEPILSRHRIR